MKKKSIIKEINSDYISLTNLLTVKDNNEAYLVMCFKNKMDEKLYSMSYQIIQKDRYGKVLSEHDFTYEDFIALPNSKFIPKVRFKKDAFLDTIECKIISAKFENSEIINGNFSTNAVHDDVINIQSKKYKPLNKKILYSLLGIASIIFAIYCIVTAINFKNTNNVYSNGDFLYIISDGNVYLTDYIKNEDEVTVPKVIDGYSVTYIGRSVFSNSQIKSVNIESNSIRLDSYSFENCTKLESFKANNVVLSPYSFYKCSSLVEFVAKTEKIPSYCFSFCTGFEEFDNSDVKIVESNAFFQCDNIKTINLKNATLYDYAFEKCPNISNITYNNINGVMLYMVFSSENIFDSISTNEAILDQNYLINIKLQGDLNLLNEDVKCNYDLSYLKPNNFKYMDGLTYLGDKVISIDYNINTLVIKDENTNFKFYKNCYNIDKIHTVRIECAFTMTSEFFSPLTSLNYIFLAHEDIKNTNYMYNNNSLEEIIIEEVGSKLSTAIKECDKKITIYNGTLPSKYFDGCKLNTVSINSTVVLNSNCFGGTFSIKKIETPTTSNFSNLTSLKNVYELEVNSYFSKITSNNEIKKLTITGDVSNGVLDGLSNLLELSIYNLSDFVFGTLFNSLATYQTQNSVVPNSIITVHVGFASVPDYYFYGCTSIKNIDFMSSSRVTYGKDVVTGCTGLVNIYSPNLTTALRTSLYTFTHEIYFLSNVTSSISHKYVKPVTISRNRIYNINYNGKIYNYEGLFLTDISNVIDSNNGNLSIYSNQTGSEKITNNYFNMYNNVYCIEKKLNKYTYYDQSSIIVQYISVGKVIKSIYLSSNQTLEYYIPTREGYTFIGWYKSTAITSSNRFHFNTPINSDLKLYAGWTSNSSNMAISINGYKEISVPITSSTTTITYYAIENGVVDFSIYANEETYISTIFTNSISYKTIDCIEDYSLNKYYTISYPVESGQTYSLSITLNGSALVTVNSNLESTSKALSSEREYGNFQAYDFEEFTLSSIPTKVGYTFDGIYTDNGYLVVDENGKSTDYWLNYSNQVKNGKLYVRFI